MAEPKKQDEAFVEKVDDTPPPKGKKKISLRLDGEGEIQWDAVSDDEKAAIIGGMLMDNDAQSAFKSILSESGEALPAGSAVDGEFSADNAKMVLTVLGSLESMLLHRALKVDKDIADKCFQFDEQQMGELAPRGAKLVNKWFPDNLKYQDECLFAGMFCYYTSLQLKAAVEMQRAKRGFGPRIVDVPTAADPAAPPENGKSKTEPEQEGAFAVATGKA
jgi:hypothetical protein